MSIATQEVPRLPLGPDSSGACLTPAEFDAAEFEEGWRYELIHGVLVVSPPPLRKERDPNDELGYWLRRYQESHPQGRAMDATLPEETVVTRWTAGARIESSMRAWDAIRRKAKCRRWWSSSSRPGSGA